MAEGFLKRWSRRKAAGAAAEKPEHDVATPPESEAAPPRANMDAPLPARAASAASSRISSPSIAEEEFDPAKLPPLESLGPDSDYTLFLKKGVPEAIRTAALRKAWVSDPFIRDHRGPAEYALDYTTSEFDLRPTDNVAKMLDSIFPPKPATDAAADAAPEAAPKPAEAVAPVAKAVPPPATSPLSQNEARPKAPSEQRAASGGDPGSAAPRRKHGGALPE